MGVGQTLGVGKIKKKAAILALANQKGGVGKSVSSTNLAVAFSQLGKQTLLIDADFQGNATGQLGMKSTAQKQGKTITGGLIYGKNFEEIVLQTNFPGLDMVACEQEFSEFNVQFLAQPGAHTFLRDWLSNSAIYEYDVIIIDTHPSIDLTFQNVMVAADYYALPLFAEPESLEGLNVMLKHVKNIKEKLNQNLHILGCLITKFDKSIGTHRRFCDRIQIFGKKFGLPVLGVIPFSKAFPSSSEKRVPLVATPNKSIPAVDAYLNLAKVILPELRPARRGRTPKTPEISKEQIETFASEVYQYADSGFQVERESRI